MKNWILGLLLFLMSGVAIAKQSTSFMEKNDLHLRNSVSFMEPNDLYLEDKKYQSNITEDIFNEVVYEVQYAMGSISELTGKQLVIEGDWSNPEVNAYASMQGDTRMVVIYGGLARRPEVTKDGLSMVICHEVGHHLGGFPFVQAWASNEGNSDYYATLACARVLWSNQPETNAEFEAVIPQYPKSLCDKAWKVTEERQLCYRTMMAGKSLGDLLARLNNGSVRFETPDRTVVRQTVNTHPRAQCRLDTYMAGSLCTANWEHETIARSEWEAYRGSCKERAYALGARPRCWFAPRVRLDQ